MYGPQYHLSTGENKRVFWWHSPSDRSWVRVAGHYHVIHTDDRNLVLDGQMGGSSRDPVDESEMKLCLYYVEQRLLKLFPCLT